METKFNFKSQVCTDKVQSERLLALGLKKETADMHHSYYTRVSFDGSKSHFWKEETGYSENAIPAWSLHRLVELIWGDGEHDMSLETHRPFEDCIERIDYMINQSHCFNKEYLVL